MLLIISGMFFIGCKKDACEPINSELTGKWERYDGNYSPLNAMQVEFDGTVGVITKSPATVMGFAVGKVKWKTVSKTAGGVYDMQDLSSDGSYTLGKVFILTDGKELMLSGQGGSAGNYQKWRRL